MLLLSEIFSSQGGDDVLSVVTVEGVSSDTIGSIDESDIKEKEIKAESALYISMGYFFTSIPCGIGNS